MIQIIKHRKIYYWFSGILMLLSIVSLVLFRLNLGIDFTGGSLLEVQFINQPRPEISRVEETLSSLQLQGLETRTVGENSMNIRFQAVEESVHQDILRALRTQFQDTQSKEEDISETENSTDTPPDEVAPLKTDAPQEIRSIEEVRFEAIGPTLGKELQKKAFLAILLAIVLIIGYIAFAFRHVSKPLSSWKYGFIAVIALFHDVLLTLGVFSLLGRFVGTEVNAPFLAAILTVFGYSVNDTIVVFDRIRENLLKSSEGFSDIVNASLVQTLPRSINTSFTTLLTLFAILFFGGATLHEFSLALIVGLTSGTYSSIFLASPLLVSWYAWMSRRESNY